MRIAPKRALNARSIPATIRFQSTETTKTSGTRLLATLATASLVGGTIGFYAADALPSNMSRPAQKNYEKPQYGGPKEVAAAKQELLQLFPSRDGKDSVTDDKHKLEFYGYSPNSYHEEHLHSLVVKVLSTDDVVKVVNVARKYRIPVIAFTGGTSLEGHYSGVRLLQRSRPAPDL